MGAAVRRPKADQFYAHIIILVMVVSEMYYIYAYI